MLVRALLKNIYSFYSGIEFNMLINPKRKTFPNHIYTQTLPIVKLAAIYGANGAGKTNFIKAISFIKDIVTNKNLDVDFDDKKYQLVVNNNEASVVALEFIKNERMYMYYLKINNNTIIDEILYQSFTNKNKELIFKRSFDGNIHSLTEINANGDETIDSSDSLNNSLNKGNNRKKSILLLNTEWSFINNVSSHILDDVFNWFNEDLNILDDSRSIPGLIELIDKNKQLLDFVNSQINKYGLGINKLSIETTKLSELFANDDEKTKKFKEDIISKLNRGEKSNASFNLGKNKRDLVSFSVQDGIEVAKEFAFENQGKDNYHANLGADKQSLGTHALLECFPTLFDIIYKDKIYLIDELETSLHPSVMKKMIQFFGESKSKGQLIFSTHQSSILDQQEVLRPDEVWFAEKTDGETKLYSLNDFKEHNTIDIQKGYLAGRYGAIPFLADTTTLNENAENE